MSMIIDGTNGLTFNNATTQNSGGKVLQVLNFTNNTATSTTSTSLVNTSLALAITPLFSTSKILIISSVFVRKDTGSTDGAVFLGLTRGGTLINGSSGISQYAGLYTNTNSVNSGCLSFSYLDSPATTSSTTYTIQIASGNASSTARMNVDNSGYSQSNITLMEIAA